jgi:hypothetical protein
VGESFYLEVHRGRLAAVLFELEPNLLLQLSVWTAALSVIAVMILMLAILA